MVRNRGVLAGLVALSMSAQPAVAAGDAAAGKGLAIQWCRSCHLIDDTGRAVDGARPFPALAHDPEVNPDRLSAFLVKPHGGMPGLSLSRQEIADLIAYIESLR